MRGRLWLVPAALAVLALALLVATLQAAPASGASTAPDVRFSFTPGDDASPTLLIASGYAPVAVWTDPDGALRLSQLPLVGSPKDGLVLSNLPRDASAPVDGTPERAAMDAGGRLQVVWDDGAGGVWHKVYAANGNVLSVNHLMSAGDRHASSPAITAAPPGRDESAWIAWIEYQEGFGPHVRLVSIDAEGNVLASWLVDGYGADLAPVACDVFVDAQGLPQVTFLGSNGAYWARPPEEGGALLAVHGGAGSLPVVMDLGTAGLWAAWRQSGSVVASALSDGALGPAVTLVDASSAPSLPRATDASTVAAGGPAAVLAAGARVLAVSAGDGGAPQVTELLTLSFQPSSPSLASDARGQSYAAWTDARTGSMDCYFRVLARGVDVALEPPLAMALGEPVPLKVGSSIQLEVQVRSRVAYATSVDLEVRGSAEGFSAELVSAASLTLEPWASQIVLVRLSALPSATAGTSATYEVRAYAPGWPDAAAAVALTASVPRDIPFVVRGPTGPVPLLPGDPVTLQLGVESWSTRDLDVTLLIDVPLGWEAHSPKVVHVPAGETVEVDVELTAPPATPAGTTAMVTVSGETSDGVQGTGTVLGAVVQSHAGVAISLGSASLAVMPGGNTSIEGRVRNTGNVPLDLDLTAATEVPGWSGSVEPSRLQLQPGSESPMLVQASSPEGAIYLTGCTVHVRASAPGLSDPADALLRVTVDRLVSYAIEAFPTPMPLGNGEATMQVRVLNRGNAVESFSVEVAGLPTGWSADAPALRGPFTVGPFGTSTTSVRLVAPQGAAPGAVTFAFILHGPREPATAGAEIRVPTLFAAEVQSPSPVATLTPPGSVTFPLQLLGRGNIGGNVTLAASGVPTGWDFSFQTVDGADSTTFGIAAGGRADAVLAVRVPADATAESVAIDLLCHDARGLVLSRLTVYVRLRFPDLALSDPVLSTSSPRAGTGMTLRVRVLNLGGADAQDVVVVLKDGDRVLDREQISIVPLDGFRDAVFYFVPSAGDRTLYVQADPGGRIPELIRNNNMLTLPLRVAPAARSPVVTPEVAVVSVAAIGTLSVIGVLGGTEVGRYAVWASLLIPLYTKLMKDRVLDHYLRGKIHGYIIANPGEHYNAIKEQLDVTNGALSYHLRVLEREGYIRSRMDGMYKRFYPSEMKLPRSTHRISSFQEVILTIVKNNQGVSQKDIARRIGVSSQVINYHIKLLEDSGLINVDRTRRKSRVYATDAPTGAAEIVE